MSVFSGPPDRKQTYKNSRKIIRKIKIKIKKKSKPQRTSLEDRQLYERNHHSEILYAPDSIQGIPEENSSPAAWTDGSLQLWDSKRLSKFGQRNPLLGSEWEMKKTSGLTAAKTKIPLHQI